MNNNTMTLTEAIKALYTANTNVSVKEIINNLQTHQTHLKADYRKVYNTLKRISQDTSKVSKASKTEKTSIIFDLTQPAGGPTVSGTVIQEGRD